MVSLRRPHATDSVLRERCAHQVRRWLWTDSSPQKNFDWVWSEYVEVEERDVWPVFDATVKLAKSVLDFMEGNRDDLDRLFENDVPDGWSAWHTQLESVSHHICIPTAVSSGQRDLVHKVSALMHSFGMESKSLEGLRVFLSSVRSFTSDMGTELSMPDFRCESIAGLAPEWFEPSGLMLDVDSGHPVAEHGRCPIPHGGRC